ncbi:MAG TPA: hypothetical protein VMW83_10290 [Spirochaetia bacterium]|nr:hypothetical protein [Spirochaetia bacterium]
MRPISAATSSSWWAQEGVTIFLTTHNLAEAEKLCTLVGIINHGKMVALDQPDRLRARAAGNTRVEIGGHGIDDRVLDLVRAHPQVASVTREGDRIIVELVDKSEAGPVVALLVQAGVMVEEVHREKANLSSREGPWGFSHRSSPC